MTILIQLLRIEFYSAVNEDNYTTFQYYAILSSILLILNYIKSQPIFFARFIYNTWLFSLPLSHLFL